MAIIAPDLGIDLGTCNTLVYANKGIVLNEPTLLIISGGEKRTIRHIGQDAQSYIGRTTGGDVAVRPLQEGTVKDYDLTEAVLRYFIRKAIGVSHLVKPRVCITTPCNINDVEKRVIIDAAINAGARRNAVHLIDKPFAAAHGSALPVFEPIGTMVVDIGAGTTEIAVISTCGIVISRSIKAGGMMMDQAIAQHILRDFNMQIGETMAERTKIDWGSAILIKEESRIPIRGRERITGLPQTVETTSHKVYHAIHGVCELILKSILEVLSKTPPEISADILKKGIFISGGGAKLYGLERYLGTELGLPIHVAKEPMLCAAIGVGELAAHPEEISKIIRNHDSKNALA